jgi:hypothetical protein
VALVRVLIGCVFVRVVTESEICCIYEAVLQTIVILVFMSKPCTHHMHDPGSIVPHIRSKSVHRQPNVTNKI